MARKSVEKYVMKKIQVPELKGEALFGLHSVLEATRAQKRDFHAVYLKKTIEKRAGSDSRIKEILTKLDGLHIEKTLLSDDQLDRLTEFQLHNGICVDASPLEYADFEAKNVSIFVDKVLDPGNLGAIGRSAWYFGADGIGFAKGRGPKAITPSMSKSSCGALEHLPVQQFKDFHEFRDKIKTNGGEIVATCDPLAAERAGLKAKTLDQWQPARSVGIVLGDEGIGISRGVLHLCDTIISIAPVRTGGSNVTSLNVSVVAGILLHHISLFRNQYKISTNGSVEICSNGAKPGSSCHLVPSSGYECTSSNSSTNWCENFNGTYKCCEKSMRKCQDRSAFCKLTRHLCKSRTDFRTMKSKCEATCGFCGLDSFDQAERMEKRLEEVASGQECDLPRKCVFPREKMLNSTENSASATLVIDPIVAYRAKLKWNTTSATMETQRTTVEYNSTSTESSNVTTVDLKTLLQTTGKSLTNVQIRNSTSGSRRPRTINTVDPNETLKTFATRNRNETTSSLTLPASFNSTSAARKITLEELRTTRDTMPKITTAEPSSLTTSLTKTVIQGTCFDEYTYCREFTSLCSHPAFSEVMASHCSLTCDRCDEVERIEEGREDCEDITPDCSSYRDLCQHSRYKTLMENYCPKACGHCVPMCRDRHQNCPQFHDDGFCNDTMYTYEERKYLCGATCLLC
ncbi:unnamed protein product [Caenorhabditis sp. 36 PRJEB53466]|nr:unnamed protein product [Caenorhabditis sp. 36 PRJEB53466]